MTNAGCLTVPPAHGPPPMVRRQWSVSGGRRIRRTFRRLHRWRDSGSSSAHGDGGPLPAGGDQDQPAGDGRSGEVGGRPDGDPVALSPVDRIECEQRAAFLVEGPLRRRR